VREVGNNNIALRCMEEFRIDGVQTKEKKSPFTYSNVKHKWRKEM
jgi:hypothetical protein